MKANAPEKIYINGFSAFATVPVKEGVEYIRIDAFIEKAAEWMFSQANVYSVTHVSNDGGIHTNFYADKMVEDFKNYMKGE